METIFKLLAPPTYENDPDKTQGTTLLNTFSLILAVVAILAGVLSVISTTGESLVFGLGIGIATLLISLISLWLLRRGRLTLASSLVTAFLFVGITLDLAVVGGLRSPAIAAYLVIVAMAGFLINGRAALILTIMSALATLGVLWGEQSGRFATSTSPQPTFVEWFLFVLVAVWMGLIIQYATNNLRNAFRALRTSNAELENLTEALEERVQERTRVLELSLEVSRSLSQILTQQELVQEVTKQIRQAFDYYHVQIYLFDEEELKLRMVGGTGDSGRALLAANHALSPSQGLVGRAFNTRQTVLIPDVSLAPFWLPNPLLPDTKAEAAVPILSGKDVFGVLDVQQNVTRGLSEEDTSFLEAVASQVAVAVRNTRLYEGTQRRAEQEALVNHIGRRIRSTTNMEEMLQVATYELGRATNAEKVTVQLSHKAGNGRR